MKKFLILMLTVIFSFSSNFLSYALRPQAEAYQSPILLKEIYAGKASSAGSFVKDIPKDYFIPKLTLKFNYSIENNYVKNLLYCPPDTKLFVFKYKKVAGDLEIEKADNPGLDGFFKTYNSIVNGGSETELPIVLNLLFEHCSNKELPQGDMIAYFIWLFRNNNIFEPIMAQLRGFEAEAISKFSVEEKAAVTLDCINYVYTIYLMLFEKEIEHCETSLIIEDTFCGKISKASSCDIFNGRSVFGTAA